MNLKVLIEECEGQRGHLFAIRKNRKNWISNQSQSFLEVYICISEILKVFIDEQNKRKGRRSNIFRQNCTQ